MPYEVIYPRAMVSLRAQVGGDLVTTPVVPYDVSVVRRPHHQADGCECKINLSALPFDPRTINGVFVSAFMGAVPTVDSDVLKQKYLRFLGYADDLSQHRGKDGNMVTLKARDLSSIFREAKPLAEDATPRYSDTVTQALQRAMSSVNAPGQTDITQIIAVSDQDGLGSRTLASLVNNRGATGRVPLKRDTTVWEAIEYIGRLANLLVSVELDKLVLRAPKDAFGADPSDPQTRNHAIAKSFEFGTDAATLFEVELQKKILRNRKGIRLVSYDPKARRSISADWPPDAQIPAKKRPPAANTHGAKGSRQPPDPERDVIQMGSDGIQTLDQLQAVAQRIWTERARQEMEGSFTTHAWDDDLFALANGDRIGVRYTPALEAELRNFQGDEQRAIAFIEQRLQVSADAARVLLKGTRSPQSTLFYLRSVTHHWTPKVAESKVDFINLIAIG